MKQHARSNKTYINCKLDINCTRDLDVMLVEATRLKCFSRTMKSWIIHVNCRNAS